ncbi:Uncharacterised protein [Sphingobacterium mizutaii]|uniref:Uncharacterized protein n=1 Tax=Sphingobacterium mizutaii TaxID=1010 RepID=A0AAJ5BYR6_9SPHI|nr:hypothetical protein SAMN05192578_11129 [Sphingobacterium mizutaii]SNV38495.1 Uncharacterised protein [Sphingobacterium mizutaii]
MVNANNFLNFTESQYVLCSLKLTGLGKFLINKTIRSIFCYNSIKRNRNWFNN